MAQNQGLTVSEKSLETFELATKAAGDALAIPPESVRKVFAVAAAIRQIKAALTPEIMTDIMALQGSKLGFRTDKDKDGGYNAEVVKDVVVFALMKSARLTGNEVNIIAGNGYLTKEYYERLLLELPGFSNMEIEQGVPVLSTTGQISLVPFEAHWKYKNNPMLLSCKLVKEGDKFVSDTRIPVRVNSGMIIDAIIGKALRKLYARIYQSCTGSAIDCDEISDLPADSVIPAKIGDSKKRLAKKAQAIEVTGKEQAKSEQPPQPEPSQDADAPDEPKHAGEEFIKHLSQMLVDCKSRGSVMAIYQQVSDEMDQLGERERAEKMIQDRMAEFPKA